MLADKSKGSKIMKPRCVVGFNLAVGGVDLRRSKTKFIFIKRNEA
jgi:hypothetical protein